MNKIKDINEEDNNSQRSNNTLTSNSETQNNNGKREKRTRNRPSKAERYSEERINLIKSLNKMIGLNENNKILLYDLEHNEELKIYLRDNVSLIRKIFKTCSWGYFSNDKKKGMGNEIGLLRAIYKNDGWEISSKRKICERDGKKRLLVELHLNK